MKIRYLLPWLAAKVTRHPRYLPEITWKKDSLVYDLFRVFECIFWRRYGVRLEQSAVSYWDFEENRRKQRIVCHTFEARCLVAEDNIIKFIRSIRRVRIRISIPMAVTPFGFALPASPYLFAVAFDSSKTGAESASVASSSGTIAFVGSPSLVAVTGEYTALLSTTVGGAAVTTAIDTTTTPASTSEACIYYKTSPANGNVVWTYIFSYVALFGASAYTGTATSGSVVGAINSTHVTADSNPTLAIISQSASSLLVDSTVVTVASGTRATLTASGTGQTKTYGTLGLGNNGGTLTSSRTTGTAGSQTVSYTKDLAITDFWVTIAEFLPPAAANAPAPITSDLIFFN